MTEQNKNETIKSWMLEYGKLVYSIAFKILLNPQDAEDVFQNTFTKAYFKMGKLTSHKNIRAWLCTCARNDAINKVTSSWKKRVALVEAPLDLAPESRDLSEITYLVKKLPPMYRQCIWLYYYAGYSTDEIAEHCGCPSATVRTRLKRARERLKTDMQKIHGGESYEYQR